MTTAPTRSPETPSHGNSSDSAESANGAFEGVDLREIYIRLCKGFARTLGLIALGIGIATVLYCVAMPLTSASTSMRLIFAFNGYGKGEYPDHSKFQADDIRAPDVVASALKRQGLDSTDDFQAKIRSGLTVEGIIPQNVTKERDRLRAAGQIPAPFIPDEYLVTLTLPRRFPLTGRQRELLLNEVVSAYQEKFQRTYADIPASFGSAFESLHNADYFEYELILNGEIQNITAYLTQQLDQAKTFRSATSNLSFSDLLKETELFSQIRLSETLGLIRQNGLSSNRTVAMVKMDYYLRTLEDEEQVAVEEEKVVDDLLSKTIDRSQNYVLGIKSQATQQRTETPILDQGLIDSLLANDSANFLVRQALEAGLKVKRVQASKAQLLERRKNMEQFLKTDSVDKSAVIAQVQKSLIDLEVAYKDLISRIRTTQSDFARQQFADSIRVSMQPVTSSPFRPLALAAAVGGAIGLAFGVGMSLLDTIGAEKRR